MKFDPWRLPVTSVKKKVDPCKNDSVKMYP